MKFGICCAPGSLGEPNRLLDIMSDAGADYVEWTVGSVMASEAEFEKLRGVVEKAPLKPEAFCVFLPPHHRITGPNVDLPAVLNYATEATKRCSALGGEIIVLGSGGARKVPAGFSMETARNQFEEFCRELGPIAAAAGITIAIEPLNTSEDNLVTSVSTGAEIVDSVSHSHIQLLADYYHMFLEEESTENIVAAGAKLRHSHLADLGRVAPGFAKEGEADFHSFFKALKQINYAGRCSFEGKTDDLAAQAKAIIAHMKKRYAEA
jgi:D-psicose/D-tagatose/L-ribulose 3-epimerase